MPDKLTRAFWLAWQHRLKPTPFWYWREGANDWLAHFVNWQNPSISSYHCSLPITSWRPQLYNHKGKGCNTYLWSYHGGYHLIHDWIPQCVKYSSILSWSTSTLDCLISGTTSPVSNMIIFWSTFAYFFSIGFMMSSCCVWKTWILWISKYAYIFLNEWLFSDTLG